MKRLSPWLAAALVGGLMVPVPTRGAVELTEFMASNYHAYHNGASNYYDWVELRYQDTDRTRTATNLAGWYLTDDANDLRKWTFPATNLTRNGYLVLFASGQTNAVVNGRLHASFQLDAAGEYLALVHPDGLTIATEFAPQFPQQYRDISYGASASPTGTLVYFDLPTPGADNNAGRTIYGPLISEVAHTPPEPGDAQPLLVTARIIHPPSNVATATLHYIAQFGSQTNVLMADDGAHGDGAAGDGVYGAEIPHTAYSPNHMIRYAISALGGDNSQTRLPAVGDPADFFGTVCFDPSLPTDPPVLHWFSESNSWENANVSIINWYTWTKEPGAWGKAYLYYRGQFYPGCRVRKKGSSTITANLHKYKVVLAPGTLFDYDPAYPPVQEFNIHRFVGDESTRMREPLATDAMRAAGVPTYNVTYTRFRHNGTNESALIAEQQDEHYLARHGFDPAGALYKADPNQHPNLAPVKCSDLSLDWQQPAVAGLYNKESRTWEGQEDLDLLRTNLAQTAGSIGLKHYLFDNINLPQVINQMAVAVIIGHGDRCEKNYYVYRDSDGTREWSMFPWDFDTYIFKPGSDRGGIQETGNGTADVRSLFFGDFGDWQNFRSHSWLRWNYGNSVHTGAYTNSFNRLYDAIIRTPATRAMYLRRIRTTMDLLLGPTAPGFLENRVDHWDAIPLANVSAGDLKIYASTRRAQLYTGLGGFTEYTNIPAAQTASPTIVFGALDHTPASGSHNHEFVELRNTNAVAVDISGWTLRGGITFTFQPGTVIPALTNLYVSPRVNAFREREVSPRGGEGHFVQGPYAGQLSATGETVSLFDAGSNAISAITYPGAPLPVYDGDLRVTEIMVHPPNGDAEFIEIQNAGASPVALDGLRLTDGVTFDFATGAVTNLAPGAFTLVVRNRSVFSAVYPEVDANQIAGQYSGSLNNSGELLSLYDTNAGARVFAATYDTTRGWPVSADGAGHSLVPLVLAQQAGGRLDYGGNWRASAYRGGSPGATDPDPLRDLVLNEFLGHSDYTNAALPEYDSNDWIELFNPQPQPLALTDWYLSDDADDLRRWAIPANSIAPASGWLTFDEVTGFHNPITNGFGINKAGGALYLSHLPGGGLDRVADSVRYKGQENNTTWGRHPDGGDHWHLLTPTTNAANATPDPAAVIATLMYHPAPTAANPADNTNDEYVVVFNPGPLAQPLWTEAGPWRIDGGIAYSFPSNTTLAAGARVYLVPFPPQNAVARGHFLTAHGLVEGETTLMGPYTSRLSNQGERVALERPQAPDAPGDTVSWVIVDEVIYFDDAPWTTAADGTGLPLYRQQVAVSGNAPENWSTTTNAPPDPDADGDGLRDAWEESYFGGTNMVGGGAMDDWDLDGADNTHEYVAGTDPTNSADFFAVEVSALDVRFLARAAGPELGDLVRYYTLDAREALSSGSWMGVPGFIDMEGTNQLVIYPLPAPTNQAFYRGRAWLE